MPSLLRREPNACSKRGGENIDAAEDAPREYDIHSRGRCWDYRKS